jgi:uncharacterized membrane protein YphA (DoxX/SURF4 family)
MLALCSLQSTAFAGGLAIAPTVAPTVRMPHVEMMARAAPTKTKTKKPTVAGVAGARGRVVPTRGQALAVPADDLPFFQDPAFYQEVGELGITAMRLGTCALLVHHGFDKLQNVDGFSANVVAKFFGFLPGPPQFWTLSAAATQIAGAGLLTIGLFSRPVAASMATTMAVAVAFHLLNTGGEAFPLGIPKAHSYNYELAAMYVFVLGYFTVAGAGKYSVDEQILGGEIKLYQSALEKVGFEAPKLNNPFISEKEQKRREKTGRYY